MGSPRELKFWNTGRLTTLLALTLCGEKRTIGSLQKDLLTMVGSIGRFRRCSWLAFEVCDLEK